MEDGCGAAGHEVPQGLLGKRSLHAKPQSHAQSALPKEVGRAHRMCKFLMKSRAPPTLSSHDTRGCRTLCPQPAIPKLSIPKPERRLNHKGILNLMPEECQWHKNDRNRPSACSNPMAGVGIRPRFGRSTQPQDGTCLIDGLDDLGSPCVTCGTSAST